MSDHQPAYRVFSSDGHQARWVRDDPRPVQRDNVAVADGSDEIDESDEIDDEHLTLSWDNEAWTASGNVRRENLQYVIRISPTWQVRQFLLFRDMDEPDLWLGTDGRGNWGEMNGAHRRELDGCIDMCLSCTPFTSTIPIRRLSLPVGTTAEIVVATIDVETLDVQPDPQRYTRLDSHRWRFEQLDTERSIEFDVDEFGLVIDYPPSFRRADYN